MAHFGDGDNTLPTEWLDHPLTGDWAGHRECHIASAVTFC